MDSDRNIFESYNNYPVAPQDNVVNFEARWTHHDEDGRPPIFGQSDSSDVDKTLLHLRQEQGEEVRIHIGFLYNRDV